MEQLSFHQDFFDNPYPYYKKIRASEKPIFLNHDTGTSSKGIWLFGGYQDAVEIFKEKEKISKNISAVRTKKFATPFDLAMLHNDGDAHLRLRRLVSKYFASIYLNELKKKIEFITDHLIAQLKEKSTIDLMRDFAEPLPLNVIASLLGVPIEDMPQLFAWSQLLADSFDSLIASSISTQHQQALSDFIHYIENLIYWKRSKQKKQSTDLISFLLSSESNGSLSHDELIGMVGFLLFSGHETTINLIGNSLWLLLSNPEQYTLLMENNRLLDSAIEEVLRFESPEQRSSFRIIYKPMTIADISFQPGQQIGIIIGSANRDETIFSNPDVFDIQRTPNKHLAFGLGLHNCLGKNLARIETRVGLKRILHLCPTIKLVNNSSPFWRKNSFFRGLKTLPAVIS